MMSRAPASASLVDPGAPLQPQKPTSHAKRGDRDRVIRQVLTFLGISVPEVLTTGEGRFQRQADATSENWIELYHEVKAGPAGRRLLVHLRDATRTRLPLWWRLKRVAKVRYRWYLM